MELRSIAIASRNTKKGGSPRLGINHLQMLLNIDVLKNFAIFTEKQLCWSIVLIRLQPFSSAECKYSL